MALLQVQKQKTIEDYLMSDDPVNIMKAEAYLNKQKDKARPIDFKSFIFAPDNYAFNGQEFKQPIAKRDPLLLRRMSEIPNVANIILTRQEQILEFRNYTEDLQKSGWTIIKKNANLKDKGLNDSERRDVDKIVQFITYGGFKGKWSQSDDFDDWIKKYINDSLVLDQTCTEFERNRIGELISYRQAPSETMRLLETIDQKELEKVKSHYIDINGYYPVYAQVWQGRIQEHWDTKKPIIFYPWELSFTIRNKSSDIRRNGYGKSELEILIDVVTWILWGQQYNGNFFKQGSAPRGFFTIDGNADGNTLNEFRSAWRSTVAGVGNSHKVPIFEGGKVNWVDMGASNKDMEFGNWNEFLIVLLCSVYKIDPSELGFHFKNQADMFGQQGQKERIDHSKSKGLKPLLRMIEKDINKYIVSELDERFEFIFTGIEADDEQVKLENDVKLSSAGFVSLEDMFKKYSGRDLNKKKDTILNQTYLQMLQQSQYGGEESNEAVDEMTGEQEEGVQNPFKEKSETDPITKATLNWMDKMFKSHE